MASSVSGQDEPNRALWLATRAGKMEPSCPLGTTRCIPQAKFHQKPYNKSFIDQVCSVKMTGYWPRSFFASLWTSTSPRSINTQKKNLANIQPSWPLAWSDNPYLLTKSKNHGSVQKKVGRTAFFFISLSLYSSNIPRKYSILIQQLSLFHFRKIFPKKTWDLEPCREIVRNDRTVRVGRSATKRNDRNEQNSK